MNYVQPIKDIKKINRIKKLMKNENKFKELTLFEIGVKTGLRISDILSLKWDDVIEGSKVKSVIHIKEIKTSKAKLVRLSDKVQAVILNFL